MKVRIFIIIFFIALALLPIFHLEDVFIALSFYPILILIIGILSFIIFKSLRALAFIVYLIFLLFFFYIAPILQLSENSKFLVNTLPIGGTEIIFVNLLIFSASLITCSIYIFHLYLRKSKSVLKGQRKEFKVIHQFKIFPILLLLISFLIGVVGYKETINGFSSLLNDFLEDKESSISNLIISKYLFNIPFVVFVVLKYNNHFKDKLIYIILLLAIIFTKNPILDHRNSLGPVYLILIAFTFLNSVNNQKFTFFLIMILGIAFPLSSILTHTIKLDFNNLDTFYDKLNFFSHFKDINYDAWSEVFAAIRYTEKYGFNYGSGFLSSLFFFVPRSIWVGKSLASGYILGDFLSVDYSMWFTNLSCPVIGEGYLDFGIIGVLGYSVIFSIFLIYVDKLNSHYDIMKRFLGLFFTFQILFILRGSLMPALAYTVGFFLAWFTIYRLNIIFTGRRKI
jgi:hypothetical protein